MHHEWEENIRSTTELPVMRRLTDNKSHAIKILTKNYMKNIVLIVMSAGWKNGSGGNSQYWGAGTGGDVSDAD